MADNIMQNYGEQGANTDWFNVVRQIMAQNQARDQSLAGGQSPFPQQQRLSPAQLSEIVNAQVGLGREQIQAFSPMAQAEAYRYMNPSKSPVADAIGARDAGLASQGGLDWFKQANNVAEPTPAASLAMQGPSAANQWARLGAYQGVDPKEVERLTQNRRFGV